MISIPQLLQQIQQADVNQTGEVQWLTTNGLEAILNNLANLGLRGIMGVDDSSQLAALSGQDTQWAIIRGTGLYEFSTNANNAPSGSVVAPGGIWLLRASLPFLFPNYTKKVGDSSGTSFTITHNLNTSFPTVIVYDVLNSPNEWVSSGYSYTLTNDNALQITFTSAPANDQFMVVVKR